MKRRWPRSLWVGFLVVLAGLFSYVPLFSLFPLTRDFPWVNLLLFMIGLGLLADGMMRAFRRPEGYRGKMAGPVLMALSLAGITLFAYGLFYLGRQMPASTGAPSVGQKAPDFSLPDQDGKPVTLAQLLGRAAGTGKSSALLIFYRGYW